MTLKPILASMTIRGYGKSKSSNTWYFKMADITMTCRGETALWLTHLS